VLGHVGTFLLSAAVIALFWRAHHSVLREAEWINGTLFWSNVTFLALISLLPFPTRVPADYGDRHLGPGLYGGVIGTPSARHGAPGPDGLITGGRAYWTEPGADPSPERRAAYVERIGRPLPAPLPPGGVRPPLTRSCAPPPRGTAPP
jgi:hypothetical protein